MFLEVDGLTIPGDMNLHKFTDNPRPGTWGGERPKGLIPLGQTKWPEDIKQAIDRIFKAHGLPEPLKQKLVEPSARTFCEINSDGFHDLSKVNWKMVVDYFAWEVEAIMGTKKAARLQRQAVKKYGGIFSHYLVYGD